MQKLIGKKNAYNSIIEFASLHPIFLYTVTYCISFHIIGLLGVVSSISLTVTNSIISVKWLPPPSLDIYNVNPDITYCVDVLNSTTHTVVDSQCGITETEFVYPVPPDAICHIYTFTVTPVNGAGNGTSNIVSYFVTLESKYQLPETLYVENPHTPQKCDS